MAFLAINMLEATAMDASHGYAINALAGFLLIAASLPALGSAAIDARKGWNIVTYHLPWTWLLGYSLWNACFVYLNWAGYAFGQHVAVLGAALAVAILLGRQTWLHARALSLGLHLIVYDTFFPTFRRDFDTSSWQHPTVMAWFQLASLGLAIATCVLTLRRRRDPARRGSHHVREPVP